MRPELVVMWPHPVKVDDIRVSVDNLALGRLPVFGRVDFDTAPGPQAPGHPEGKLQLGARLQHRLIWSGGRVEEAKLGKIHLGRHWNTLLGGQDIVQGKVVGAVAVKLHLTAQSLNLKLI